MRATDLLRRLQGSDIKLWADGDQLRFDAPKGTMTAELRAQVVTHKSALLALLRVAGNGADTTPLVRVERNGGLPLSFGQQRLWFLQQMTPTGTGYNAPHAFRLGGALDLDALERSLAEILQRHEVLRTICRMGPTEPLQIVLPQPALRLPIVDLAGLPAPQGEVELDKLMGEQSFAPFDLTRGPLLRATLFKLDKTDHVLLVVMHHIVSDGWSLGVFTKELRLLYDAFADGQSSPLEDLPIQYADFAVWQRTVLQGDRLASLVAYWRKQLAGVVPLQLPTDRPRPPVQTFRGGKQRLVIPVEVYRELKAIGQREGCSLFMVLLSAFAVLLHRYSGQDDLVLGSPIANRGRSELENLIGFFVNSLALRADCAGNPTFVELLHRVRETSLEAYAHQDLPFDKLVEELQPARDLSRNPLFQVMFALQNASAGVLALEGLSIKPLQLSSTITRFDLELHMWEGRGNLSGVFCFNADLFGAATVERMGTHFQRLLTAIVANCDVGIADLPLLTDRERERLQVGWNDTATDQPHKGCVQDLVANQAATRPEQVAVITDTDTITYAQLDTRANQLAHYLRKCGVGPDVLVAVCMDRSVDMVVALLGVLRAGGAYVPIDPSYPKERLAFMLEDTGAPVLLTRCKWRERLSPDRLAQTVMVSLGEPSAPTAGNGPRKCDCSASTSIVCLDADWSVIAQEPKTPPPALVTPTHLAYVIYTSGSSGRPKGVTITHRSLMNLVNWHCRTYDITPADRATHLAGVGFDASVWEIWPHLAAGASLHIPPEDIRFDVTKLLGWLAAERITVSFLPTPLAAAAIEAEALEDLSLRLMLTGGDRLRSGPTKPLPFTLINHYGPTEATVVATCAPVEPVHRGDPAPHIGQPIDNTQAYVLDEWLNPVPVGVPGELYIGGHSLARGYWNRPELTAERFIANPFGPPGSRLYSTGDVVRRRTDGNLEFQGRNDDQVKIRGYRVELGEIEGTLARHPAIREAVVVFGKSAAGFGRLVAYVVPESNGEVSHTELRDFVKKALPDYMIPAAFVTMAAFPLTAHGKVDRGAMPEPVGGRDAGEAFVAPQSELERGIADIWQEALDVERVGLHDSFFDLGGHSLLLVKVQTQLKEAFGQELTIVEMFEHPTVAALARRLGKTSPERHTRKAKDDRSAKQQAGKARLKQRLAKRNRPGTLSS